MKTLEQPELTLNLPFQDTPFVVTGQTEAVLSLAEAVQAADKHIPVTRAPKHGKAIVEAVRVSGEGLLGRIATDIETRVFDARMGTNLYPQLVQKRKDEKIVRQGVKIGLISLTDTVCQRHAHAVDKLKV